MERSALLMAEGNSYLTDDSDGGTKSNYFRSITSAFLLSKHVKTRWFVDEKRFDVIDPYLKTVT